MIMPGSNLTAFAIFAGALIVSQSAVAADDPCENFRYKLSHTRSADPEPVDLILNDVDLGAELNLRIPRTFVANYGNLTSGVQCHVAIEVSWPSMSPAGPVEFSARTARDQMSNGEPSSRRLTISIDIAPRWLRKWFATTRYCDERLRLKELDDRPYGLRVLDDAQGWPSIRQSDGTYRNMKELAVYPLVEGDIFYFVDGPVNEMVRINCGRGSGCRMQTALGGLWGTIIFSSTDLSDWRELRTKVSDLVDRFTVSKRGPQVAVHDGSHSNPDPRLLACMRDMLAISGAEGQSPSLDVTKQR